LPIYKLARHRKIRTFRPTNASHFETGFHSSKEVITAMIRKLKSGEYRLYSKKKDAKTGKRKNLGTFKTRDAAEKHEREVQYFKQHA
jgi:hypothetical protein